MYLRPLKRHRILEIGQVTWTSLLGGLVLFFGLIVGRCDLELPAVLRVLECA